MTEKRHMETWIESYISPIFGDYTLRFKIYEINSKYIIEIENSLTDDIYTVGDNFSSYDEAVERMSRIKDNLIPFYDEDLEESM